MNEVEKHCQVLGIDEACSRTELEEAYQERAQAWKPEKFVGNAPLQEKAREKLNHINAARDYLLASLFGAPAPASAETVEVPQPAAAEWKPEPIVPAPRKRTAFFITVAVLLFFVLCAALLLIWGTDW